MITLVLSVCILLTSTSPNLAPVSDFLSLLFVFNCAFVVWRVLRAPSWERIAVAGCLLVILAMALRDVAVYLGWLESRIFLLHYTCLIFLIMAAVLLGRRAANNARRIEQFNHELIEAVDRARIELRETLQKDHDLALSNLRLQERLQLAHDLHDGLVGAGWTQHRNQQYESPNRSIERNLCGAIRARTDVVASHSAFESIVAPRITNLTPESIGTSGTLLEARHPAVFFYRFESKAISVRGQNMYNLAPFISSP